MQACFTDDASHPTRVRGLKPYAGLCKETRDNPSHPTRVRGLKRSQEDVVMLVVESHPTRVRGLKPPAGACIEIRRGRRTPRGCVD